VGVECRVVPDPAVALATQFYILFYTSFGASNLEIRTSCG
jgi:hypothetical protein